MKKIILSLAVISSLLTIQAMASDTTSLTRATVKLIKSQQDTHSYVSELEKNVKVNSDLINKSGEEIKKLEQKNSDLSQKISEVNSMGAENAQHILNLQEKVEEAKDISKKAEQNSIEAKNLILEMRTMNGQYKEESGRVISSAESAYQKSTIIEEKNRMIEDSIYKLSEKLSFAEAEIERLKSSREVSQPSGNNTEIERLNSELQELKDKVSSITKTTLSKPVVINCNGEKCRNNENADLIIQDFIK